MLDRLRRLHPFQTPDAQRLAILFAVVYFAKGMWSLPNLSLTITLKERGLSAGQVATFFSFGIIPWLIKPVYGLLSDCVPLFGRRRKSYLLLTSALAAGAGLAMGLAAPHSYWWLVGLITVMGLGLAFTDVLVDALMVENGKPRGLTGAFQAVQWAAIYTAAVLVGVLGGFLAERRSLSAAFTLAALFPLISFSMTLFVVHDPPARADRKAFRQTMAAVREAVGGRDLWIVAGAIFYAPLSRRVPLKRLINVSIGAGVAGLLAYLLYRDAWSAVVIDIVFGCVGMITQLAFLAAKACPRRVEATFFA